MRKLLLLVLLAPSPIGTAIGDAAEQVRSVPAASVDPSGLRQEVWPLTLAFRRSPMSWIVVVGQSAGGWGSIALASLNPDGVKAVIVFRADYQLLESFGNHGHFLIDASEAVAIRSPLVE